MKHDFEGALRVEVGELFLSNKNYATHKEAIRQALRIAAKVQELGIVNGFGPWAGGEWYEVKKVLTTKEGD